MRCLVARDRLSLTPHELPARHSSAAVTDGLRSAHHGCSILRELGNFEAATESFQKALLLNQNHVQTLQLRGMMLYHHGSLQEALKNFKVSVSSLSAVTGFLFLREFSGAHCLPNSPGREASGRRHSSPDPCDTNSAFCPKPQRCLQLEPYNEVCQYMKGLSHVAMGQFYEGIKAQTKVMLNDPLPGQKASPEYLRVKYLRGKQRMVGVFPSGRGSAVGSRLLLEMVELEVGSLP